MPLTRADNQLVPKLKGPRWVYRELDIFNLGRNWERFRTGEARLE